MSSEVDAEAISNDPAQHDPSYQPYHDARPPSHAKDISNPTPPMDPEAEEEPIQPPKDFNEHFPAHLPVPPFIHVQGVPNFRDLGGYPCPPPPSVTSPDSSKQYMVRKNLLFRCAHPTQLTSHGAATLRNLGITNIYDLRSAPEIDKLAHTPPASPTTEAPMSPGKPNQPPPLDTSNGYIIIPSIPRQFTPVYEREDYSPVALARKLQWYTSPNSPDKNYSEGFVNAYRDIATYAASGGAYATILRQTLQSAENMKRNPAMGQRRRPTSAFANLDFIIQYQKDMSQDSSPAHSRTVSRAGAEVNPGSSSANNVASTTAATDSSPGSAPDRSKTNGGIIFHCTAGKDRTGVLAAVILRLLNVSADTICWEYAITEPGLGSWRNLFIDRISRGGLGGPNRESAAPKAAQSQSDGGKERSEVHRSGVGDRMMTRAEAARICGSRASNMRAWLSEVLEGEFGGAERYLIDMVGLRKDEVERLRADLVVEVTETGEVTEPRGIKGWTLEGGMDDDYLYDEEQSKEAGGGDVNGEEKASGKLGLDTSAGREKEEKVMMG